MKVLITGGTGYVGSLLVNTLLIKGHQVRVLDNLMHGGNPLLGVWANPHFEFIRGDTRDQATIKKSLNGMDAVVHLAAIVGDPACARQPELARGVNLEAPIKIIEESQKLGVKRLVFASTCSNYGKMKDPNAYVDENSDLAPVSLYAETKVTVEKMILNPEKTKNICATSLRFSTVYGVSPRMRFDLTINEFVLEMITKKHLVVFGEKFWRPYIHVRDAARAIHTVLEAPENKVRNEVFNAGSTDQNFTKEMLVELIRPYSPEAKIEFVHKQEDPRDYRVSFSKIQNVLGFKNEHTVPDGIKEIARLIKDGVLTDFTRSIFRN